MPLRIQNEVVCLLTILQEKMYTLIILIGCFAHVLDSISFIRAGFQTSGTAAVNIKKAFKKRSFVFFGGTRYKLKKKVNRHKLRHIEGGLRLPCHPAVTTADIISFDVSEY